MSNIIDTLKGYITPDLVTQASSRLGESQQGVSTALSASFPSILSGLMNKSSDTSSMGSMMDMFKKQSNNNSGFLSNPSDMFSGEGRMLDKGKNFISSLFGSKSDDVSNVVGRSSGVKSSSASSIMAMAAPIVMGFLGKKASSNNWGTSDMVGFLKGQKDHIKEAAPAGLGQVLGGQSKDRSEQTTSTTQSVQDRSTPWLKYILIAAATLFILFLVNRSCSRQANVEDTTRNIQERPVNNPNRFTPNNSINFPGVSLEFEKTFLN